MAKTKVSEWSTTPASNTDIDGINIAEGCASSGINDAIRDMMAQIRSWQSGTYGDAFNGPVNGTIGATTPSTGAFTTLSASSTLSVTGVATLGAGAILNTPASVTLTNATGLPLTTGTTGTLATTKGGTGLTSFTANGVVYASSSSALATGSALTFDGTSFKNVQSGGTASLQFNELSFSRAGANYLYATQSTLNYGATEHIFQNNLLNTEWMRLTSTGLGIGTSSPSYKLDVAGSGRFSGSGATVIANANNGTTATFQWTQAGVGNWLKYFRTSDSALVEQYGGTDLLFLSTSGNLGLGVTPSAWATVTAMQVKNASLYGFGNEGGLYANAYYNGGWKYIASAAATGYDSNATTGQHRWFNAPSGTAGNAITFTQAMTLDASGNLGIGTTSPSSYGKFVVTGSGTTTTVLDNGAARVTNQVISGGGSYTQYYKDLTPSYVASVGSYSPASGTAQSALVFADYQGGWTERARIDSSGNLLVGTTSALDSNSQGIQIQAQSGKWGLWIEAINRGQVYKCTSDGYASYFIQGSTTVGYIATNSTSTTYATSSDYRLKNTIAPMTGALAKVALLKPVTYKWNADGSDGEGFIAHELAEVCPHAVTGEKDAVDEEGNPKYQGIDTSFLVATLTAALQEAHGLIKSLETRISALEAK